MPHSLSEISDKDVGRNSMKPFYKWTGAAVCILLLLFFPKIDINAEKNVSIVSSRTTDEDVYVYIQGVSDIISGTKVQIGNSMCENLKSADIAFTGYVIKTTILFDNSVSLSNKWGDGAKSFIKELVSNHADKEQFKIVTYAKELGIVTDYSTDYDDLLKKIDDIEYVNQDSYLTDVLYRLLLENSDNKEANFTRLIIIADGADDQEIKYTQAELTELVKASGVVIHTVGVKNDKNNQPIETLFSYSRYSGGTYTLIEGGEKISTNNTGINDDYKLYCLKITPDTTLADGSSRNVKLFLNTSEGEVITTGSIRMPFATINTDVPKEEPVIKEEDSKVPEIKEESQLPVIEENESLLPVIDVQQQKVQKTVETKGNEVLIYVLIGAAILLIIAWIVVLVVLLKRRKKKMDVVITNNNSPSVTENKTLRIYGDGAYAPNRKCVILTDIANNRRTFKAPIDSRVVIGRGTGDIVLAFDSTVSYAHCEILKKGNLYYINDLKSSNGTFYEDMRIYSETPIISGGTVKIGSCKYRLIIEE